MRRHGVSEDDLRASRVTAGYIALMRELEATARDLYREGWRGIPRLHGPARLAVAVAAASYEGILGALDRNGWDNFTRRARVSNRRKLAMIPGAWWTLRRLGDAPGVS
jgi:phytoene synthase